MNRMMKRLLVVLIPLLALILVACSNTNSESSGESSDSATGADVEASGEVLRIGMEAAYAPYNWTQADDSNGAVPIQGSDQFANGYDVQIARLIGEHLGRPVEVVKTDWEGIIPGLQADKYDLIIAGMTPTPERSEAINFTDSYYDIVFTVVTADESEYAGGTSVNDFEGARLTAQQGTAHYDMLDQFTGASVQQAASDFGAMRVALQAGKIDGYISELPEAVSASSAISGFTYEEITDLVIPEGDADYLAIGVKKGNEDLVSQVNEALATISAEEREEIMDQAIANQPSQGE